MVSHAKVAVADVVAPNVALAIGGALGGATRKALDRDQPGAGWPRAHSEGGQVDGRGSLLEHVQRCNLVATRLGEALPSVSGEGSGSGDDERVTGHRRHGMPPPVHPTCKSCPQTLAESRKARRCTRVVRMERVTFASWLGREATARRRRGERPALVPESLDGGEAHKSRPASRLGRRGWATRGRTLCGGG